MKRQAHTHYMGHWERWCWRYQHRLRYKSATATGVTRHYNTTGVGGQGQSPVLMIVSKLKYLLSYNGR